MSSPPVRLNIQILHIACIRFDELLPGRYLVTHQNRENLICQFRILEHQPHIVFEEVDALGNQDRGGFGSTGKN